MSIHAYLQPALKTISVDGEIATVRKASGVLAPILPNLFILSRGRCGFTRIKLASNNRSGLQAAKFQAARNKRFTQTKVRIEHDNKISLSAGVWSWDSAKTVSDGTDLTKVRVLPETLARKPLDKGARLVRCIDGVEGEIWQDATLLASRWWPKVPALREWQLFLRAGKYQDGFQLDAVPSVSIVEWRNDIPVIDRDPENLAIIFSPAKTALAACGLLVFLVTNQLAQQYSHGVRIDQIKQQLDVITRDNQDAYRARAKALSNLTKIEQKIAIDDPLEMMKALDALVNGIPTSIGKLSRLNVTDRILEAQFRVQEDADIAEIVTELEKNPGLSDIFIERTSARFLTIRGKLVKLDSEELYQKAASGYNDGESVLEAGTDQPSSSQSSLPNGENIDD